VVKNETKFAKIVMAQSAKEQIKIMATKKQTAQKIHNRINELDTLIERIYEDNVIGKLTDERFTKLSAKYETEQAELTNKLTALADEIADLESKTANVDRFISKVRKYTTEIDKLTPAIVREFVDKIIVSEATNPRKNRVQEVRIIYNDVGVVPCLEMKVGA
jgi:phosphopantetheine adenylyltransferase